MEIKNTLGIDEIKNRVDYYKNVRQETIVGHHGRANVTSNPRRCFARQNGIFHQCITPSHIKDAMISEPPDLCPGSIIRAIRKI